MEGKDKQGRFTKGNSFGARKRKPEIDELRKAIKAVEKEKGKNILKHFVERGLKNDSVLVALIKKLVPDKVYTEGDLKGTIKIIFEDVESGKDSSETD